MDRNASACGTAIVYVEDTVKPTFGRWKPSLNEFDQRVGRELRTEGTHLYKIQGPTTGPTSQALGAEASGLTRLSIAIEERDGGALTSAANSANSALAQLRGVCNF